MTQGYNEAELIAKFGEIQSKIRPAVERMISEADAAVAGKIKTYTMEEVFGEEDDD